MKPVVHARLSAASFALQLSGAARAAATLQAIWGPSGEAPFLAEHHRFEVAVRPSAAGFLVEGIGETSVQVATEALLPPTIERFMYDAFIGLEASSGRAVLHASGVQDGDDVYVFAGVSGAGKSALARAALAAGCRYFGDEHLVVDARQIWGIPRALHLDLEPYEQAAAPWHDTADRDSYVFEAAPGRRLRLPFIPVLRSQIAERPAPLERLVLVALSHGDRNEISPLGAAGRVALVERAHFVRGPGLSHVALAPRALALSWREPNDAFALLRNWARASR